MFQIYMSVVWLTGIGLSIANTVFFLQSKSHIKAFFSIPVLIILQFFIFQNASGHGLVGPIFSVLFGAISYGFLALLFILTLSASSKAKTSEQALTKVDKVLLIVNSIYCFINILPAILLFI